MEKLQRIAPLADLRKLKKITSFGYAIQSSKESPYVNKLPDFPLDNLQLIALISQANPLETPYQLIKRLYPFNSFPSKECRESVMSLLETLEFEIPKEKRIWNLKQCEKNDKIVSVDHPTLSKEYLNSFQHHKSK